MVTETEELIGVFIRISLLPQYFIQAIFDGAVWVTWISGYTDEWEEEVDMVGE